MLIQVFFMTMGGDSGAEGYTLCGRLWDRPVWKAHLSRGIETGGTSSLTSWVMIDTTASFDRPKQNEPVKSYAITEEIKKSLKLWWSSSGWEVELSSQCGTKVWNRYFYFSRRATGTGKLVSSQSSLCALCGIRGTYAKENCCWAIRCKRCDLRGTVARLAERKRDRNASHYFRVRKEKYWNWDAL